MPFTQSFPFRRVAVDHLIAGVSRIWWQLHPGFKDAGDHTFQLQAGYTGNINAADWTDVGSPTINAWYAEDDHRRLYGMRLLTHYRVKLTTAAGLVYVSNPAGVYGELPEHDWVQAREILRKEQLRSGLIGAPGYLVKRMRYGRSCTKCLDHLTGAVLDERCPECKGTGFQVGFHAPVPLQCWDITPQAIAEKRNGDKPPGQIRDAATIKARVLACPDLALEDVWVNGKSDERWAVDVIEQVVAPRGVPLVLSVTLQLIPYTDVVYKIQVGGEPNDQPDYVLPTAGGGCIEITHDYGGEDALAAQDAQGCGIPGVYILAIPAATYLAGGHAASDAVAATSTLANGRWAYALKLNAGNYYLVFEKPGEFGPNAVPVTVTGSSSSVAASLSSSASSFGPV